MINTYTPFYQLSDREREQYGEHLANINKIYCSYSRLEAFHNAQLEIKSASLYTVVAYSYIPHNTFYIADNEGFVTAYVICETDT